MAELYVGAYRKLFDDTRFKAAKIEYQTIGCLSRMQYGMKLDREGLLNGRPDVLETKTAEKSESAWGVQLAAYTLALPRLVATLFRYQRVAVHLWPNGTWRILTYDDPGDEKTFSLSLGLACWKRLRNF